MKRLYLLYHELRPEPSRYAYVVPCTEFAEHCRLYRELQRVPSGQFLRPEVTFDDGNLSDYRYALPGLAEAGLHAHFFITAGWTGQRAGYMGAEELRALQAAGMTVGAHGWSHALLTACTDAELRTELVDAKARLEDILGGAVPTMSLPGGRANTRVLRACRAAGYTTIFTSEPRPANDTGAGLGDIVGRLNLRGGIAPDWLTQVLQPKTGVLARQQRSDRVKSVAKAVLGDRLYAAAWSLVNRHEIDDAAKEGANGANGASRIDESKDRDAGAPA